MSWFTGSKRYIKLIKQICSSGFLKLNTLTLNKIITFKEDIFIMNNLKFVCEYINYFVDVRFARTEIVL